MISEYFSSQQWSQMKKSTYWVYILYCDNNTYYTGYTTDIKKRYQAHLDGTSQCKYTRSFKPLYIAQSWKINGNRSCAMKVEAHIKKLSRIEKEKIIHDPSKICIHLDLVNMLA